MPEDFEVSASAIDRDMVVDKDENLRIASLQLDRKDFRVGFHWLPELFRVTMPADLREEIVRRLRFHADMLESGELHREMQKYLKINDPEGHD
jgi:hypothetical protein